MPSAVVGAGTASLAIARVNPLECGDEIKQLFLAHERPEFPEFFERAYRGRSGEGALSWVGWDEHGCLQAHIALFPRRFWFGGRVVRGALLANMMVATAYRTFWPGLAVVRQMVRDTRLSGSVDFLYADPNDPARALAQRAGFREVGVLRRFVLPLGDRRRSVDLGLRLYHLIRGLQAPTTALAVTERPAGQTSDPPNDAPAGDARVLCPIRGEPLYRARLPGYPSPSDRWITVHPVASPDAPVGRALVRGPDARGVTLVCALECESPTLVGPLLVALGHQVRRAGSARLELSLVAESQTATDARRAGFIPRDDRTPILALSFTAAGADAVAAGSEWRLLPIDLDR